jgi:hypothetical protein
VFVFTDETSRSSTTFKIRFLLFVTALLIISQVYNCITHMPIKFIPVHIFSYTWKHWQTCCCSFSSFSTSCRTLAPTHYMTCYYNIHTSLHSIFYHQFLYLVEENALVLSVQVLPSVTAVLYYVIPAELSCASVYMSHRTHLVTMAGMLNIQLFLLPQCVRHT